MVDKVKNCVVQILNREDKYPTGTGFFISQKGYIVTCHHVIYTLDDIWIQYKGKRVQAIWCREYSNINADIAVLKIEPSDIDKIEIVKIVNPLSISFQEVMLYGFPDDKFDNYPDGSPYYSTKIKYAENVGISKYFTELEKESILWSKHPKNSAKYSSIRIYDVSVDSGTSGGLVYLEKFDGVVGIVQSSYSDSDNKYTNAIRWENFLDNLTLNQKKELDLEYIINFLEESLDTSLLKKALNNIGIPLKEIEQIANSSLPITSKKTLLGSVETIIKDLADIRDYDDSKNIPILCFAKEINSQENDRDIDRWIKEAEEYFEIKTDELRCAKRELTDAYNILIEISISNNIETEATIQVFKNISSIKSIEIYESVDIDCSCCEKINLYNTEDRKVFVDELIGYLEKFKNPRNILLEFILPQNMIDLNIQLWEDSDGFLISEEYHLIYRLKERFNKKYYLNNQYWKENWVTTYGNNKSRTLKGSGSYINESEIDDINVNITFDKSCIITKFSIYETDIFKRVLKFGISIIISPHSLKTEEELKEFSLWFEKNLNNIEVQNSVKEINRILRQKRHKFRSNIVLIWDNYNRVPEIYKGYRLGE